MEIRRKANGSLIGHWFGAYKDGNGKRKITPLTEPLPVKHYPGSLRDMGNAIFEASRTRAEKELETFQTEARQQGRADHLTERLIESKTGRKWKETQLADLPRVAQTMKGNRSKVWRKWQVAVIGQFTDWAQGRGFRSVLEITPEVAESYIEKLTTPNKETQKVKAPSTLRHVKNILSMVLDRALPNGVDNPFKNIRIETPDGGETAHRKPLNPVEVDRLLIEAKADPFVYPLIVTALSTGLRRGDVCRLKWSSVNLKKGALTVKTSKTGAGVTLPIMDTLRTVLESALAEREEGAGYVFKDAERMLRQNPDGITYRVKKVFALAFAMPQDAVQIMPDTPPHTPLAKTLPKVLRALQSGKMTTAKREKIADLLALYASGKSYRDIQGERKISRGAISGLLHEAEALANVRFLPDTKTKPDSVKQSIKDVTRKSRTVGMRSASKYDFHALRTTFVTLAIGGKNPMPVEKVIALTGHRTVETAMKYYFKPEGTDFRSELENAMPQSLTGRNGARLALKEADPVASMAAQFETLTQADRARLAQMLNVKGGK